MELDVRLSKDGVPMVFHDLRLTRMCGVSAPISGLTCKELQGIKGAGGFRVPTLESVLDLAHDTQMGVYVELKDTGPKVVSAVAPLVANSTIATVVSSFHHPTLWQVQKAMPYQPLMALVERRWHTPWRQWPSDQVQEVGIALNLARPALIDELRGRGWDVLVFTVNEAATAKRLREQGVAGVFCDHAGGL